MLTKRQLAQIQNTQERQMLQTFAAVLADIRNNADLNQIVKHLDANRIDLAVDALGLDRAMYMPLEESIRESYKAGGLTGAQQVGTIEGAGGKFVARFDIRSKAAEAWLATQAGGMIVELIEGQRETITGILTQALSRGDNPRTAALDLVGRINATTRRREGGFVGLTSNQAGWVSTARQELYELNPNYLTRKLRDMRHDKRIIKAIESGTPLPDSVIDSAITKMQTRAERYRAETIARTETVDALRAGQAESIEQAIELGEFEASETVKRWRSSGNDGRTRDAHFEADGQVRLLDAPFDVGGEQLMYPGDTSLGASAENTIQCRCGVEYEIMFGKQLRRLEGFG